PLAELDQPGADLVNWVISPIGMAGEAGVWLNQGANLSFSAGRAWIENLNERIIELPWAHAAASRLPTGSAVLDIGAAESLFAIELATMGHRTIALDPRGYGLTHPNLDVVTEAVEDWDGPSQPLDAVFSISAIEHFGLGHYVPAAEQSGLDRVAMERFASWLRPDGLLFLTAPFGTWSVDELQRVYDTDHLAELIDGWKVIDRSVYARASSTEWSRLDAERIDAPWAHPDAGVVLLELARPAP
ncbi:MAG: class I SAM-dependent methyltransferase, partial [Acidimicrobiales bacterium]